MRRFQPGGGNIDYYMAVSPIYPLAGIALLVESRLSAQAQEQLPNQTREQRWTSAQRRLFYCHVGPVIVGLVAAVVGVWACLGALIEAHASRRQFQAADAALGIEGIALAVLVILHVFEMTADRIVLWIGSALILGLLVAVGYGLTHP